MNYVACHDGFTTADLTQYRHKHNEANGENNRDGSDNNHSVISDMKARAVIRSSHSNENGPS